MDCFLGSYGTGIGSLTSHPYQYQTRPFGDDLTNGYQPNSYAEELLRTAHAHGDHPGEQPEHYPNDRYAQGPSSNNQASKGFHSDDNHATQPLHKTTTDYQQHHVSIFLECLYEKSVLERLLFSLFVKHICCLVAVDE